MYHIHLVKLIKTNFKAKKTAQKTPGLSSTYIRPLAK